MPGLCGLVPIDSGRPSLDLSPMLEILSYGRATAIEQYEDSTIQLGCAHLGTGGQQALYESDDAVVAFFGYLTQPTIPPGADESDPAAAARYIHDLFLTRGDSLVQDIAGTFAFALWDRRASALYLVNDKLGMRPIYYAIHGNILRFASEVKAILTDPAVPHRLDRDAAAEFFYIGEVMGNHTFFEDIQLLPPASVLCLQNQKWTISNYWDITYSRSLPVRSADDYSHQICEAITGAVDRMVRPQLRYGVSLSGGLDSRWLAACLARIRPDSLTFTVGDPDSDDVVLAQQVADQLGLLHHSWDLPYTFIPAHAEKFMYIIDGMFNLVATEEFPLTVRVGDYVDVSVGGLLGDTLFGHWMNPVSANLRRDDVMKYYLWQKKSERLPRELMARVFGEQTQRELEERAIQSLSQAIESAPAGRGFQVLQHVKLRTRQRRFTGFSQLSKLPYVDMYHPFLDEEVVRVALTLPASQLMVKRAYRRALAECFPDMAAIPWAFIMQPPTTSALGVITYKASQVWIGKRLRGTPLANIPLFRPLRVFTSCYKELRHALRGFVEKMLLAPEANATDLFAQDGLRTALEEYMEGRAKIGKFVGQAIAFSLWTRLFYMPSTPVAPIDLAAPAADSD